MQRSVRSLRGKGFAKQLAVNHVVLMVMCSGSNYWPGAVYINIYIVIFLYTHGENMEGFYARPGIVLMTGGHHSVLGTGA